MSEQTQRILDPLEKTLQRMMEHVANMTPEEKEIARLKKEASDKEEQMRRVNEHLQNSNVPKRQVKNTSIDRSGDWGQIESRLVQKLGTGFLVALIGVRGSGKTQLAVELIRQNAIDFKTSLFCTAMEFFMRIKAGYHPDGETESQVIHAFSSPRLLVIDEIGQRSENEWENRLLYELINRRYNAVLDTLVISNQDIAQLEGALGPSIVSRMRETGGVVECDWSSYRK